MKTCTRCRETKPLNDFYLNPRGKDGINSRCKDCQKWWSREQASSGYRNRHRWSKGAVQVRTEDELRMALKDPYPFYAEPRR